MFTLIEKIKDDMYNRIVFKGIPNTFLVGGYIRDILIGRESRDRDYAIKGDPLRAAEKIRETTGGTIVRLKDGYTIRLALKGGITLDFTRYRNDITDDLISRDFTFNAIAFSLKKGIYDPTGGINDLKKGRVRTVREQNIIEDPLRIVRAYRFIGEINGNITYNTRRYLIKHKELLKNTASERITLEFIKLIESPEPLNALGFAFEDSVISEIISFKNTNLDLIFNDLSKVYWKIKASPKDLNGILLTEVSQGLTLRGLIILDILFKYAQINDSRLSLSRKVREKIERFREAGSVKLNKDITHSRLYDYFESTGDVIYETLIVQGRSDMLDEARRYLSISRHPLITGGEIMKILNIKECPAVGKLLTKLKRAEFTRRISNREEAINLVKTMDSFIQ